MQYIFISSSYQTKIYKNNIKIMTKIIYRKLQVDNIYI